MNELVLIFFLDYSYSSPKVLPCGGSEMHPPTSTPVAAALSKPVYQIILTLISAFYLWLQASEWVVGVVGGMS